MTPTIWICMVVNYLSETSGRRVYPEVRHNDGQDVQTAVGAADGEAANGVSTHYSCGESRCICDGDHADCSHQNFDHIPPLPPQITWLNFSGNNEIHNGSFTLNDALRALSNITHLDLSDNNLPCSELGAVLKHTPLETLVARRLYYCQSFCDINVTTPVPALQELDLGDSNYKYLNLTCLLPFTGLRRLVLDTIEYHTTRIVITHYQALHSFASLKYADLSNNRVSCDDLYLLGSIPTLQELKLRRGTVCSELYVDAERLPETLAIVRLDCSNNGFKSLIFHARSGGNGTSPLGNAQYIGISYNQLDTLDLQIPFPKLSIFNLRENRLTNVSCSFGNDSHFPHLTELDLSKNQMSDSFRGDKRPFKDLPLKSLNLEDNDLHFKDPIFGPQTFPCPNLTKLSLAYNNFQGVNEDKFQQLFGHLGHLRNLSLRSTSLRYITTGMLHGLTSLKTLDLSDNSLFSLPDKAFQSLTHLVMINISFNKIPVVLESTFPLATRQRLQHLDLSANPIVCNCDVLWFRNWLIDSPWVFADSAAGYTCADLQETPIQSFSMQEQACLLTPGTSQFIITTLSLILTAMSVFTLLYRYRWHIRLVLYEAFRGREDRLRRLREHCFQYDVFVSYDSDDFPWVADHLMPRLEEGMELSLCVHTRNFIPGRPIVSNIMGGLESSKKMLMLFSRSFAKSQWCQFELQLCLTHALDTEDVLLVIMLEDILSRDLTPAMMAVMKTTTYIEWADDSDAEDSFWCRMRLALNEVLAP